MGLELENIEYNKKLEKIEINLKEYEVKIFSIDIEYIENNLNYLNTFLIKKQELCNKQLNSFKNKYDDSIDRLILKKNRIQKKLMVIQNTISEKKEYLLQREKEILELMNKYCN